MDERETRFACALSVLAAPQSKGLWDKIQLNGPEEVYSGLERHFKLEVQSYLLDEYSDDPYVAAGSIIERAHGAGARIIHYWSDMYPDSLKMINHPPVVLYVLGKLPQGPAVAVVGTRKPDLKSQAIARRIAAETSEAGYVIVSGMAVGIDREAHLGALNSGGTTIGVLANGIDRLYPYANSDLRRMILESGSSALISEYPPGSIAGKWTFVRRNRIISGLSNATVVVQAGRNSGALMTAGYAMEQNREVFACSGNSFDMRFEGCHSLIRDGAGLISCTEDLLRELSTMPFVPKRHFAASSGAIKGGPLSRAANHEVPVIDGDMNGVNLRVLSVIRGGVSEPDSIVRATGLSPEEVAEALIELELSGAVLRNGNVIIPARGIGG